MVVGFTVADPFSLVGPRLVRPDRRIELIGRATISMPMDGLFVIAKARNKLKRVPRDVDRLLRRHDEQAQV